MAVDTRTAERNFNGDEGGGGLENSRWRRGGGGRGVLGASSSEKFEM